MAEYVSRAIPTEISAVSRAALKLGDNFYTVEVSEKRIIKPEDLEGIDMHLEYAELFDELNASVDAQCEEIVKTFATRR